jgi:hypothetical protein
VTITSADRAAWLDAQATVLETAAQVDPAVSVQGPRRAAEARATADLYRDQDQNDLAAVIEEAPELAFLVELDLNGDTEHDVDEL